MRSITSTRSNVSATHRFIAETTSINVTSSHGGPFPGILHSGRVVVDAEEVVVDAPAVVEVLEVDEDVVVVVEVEDVVEVPVSSSHVIVRFARHWSPSAL